MSISISNGNGNLPNGSRLLGRDVGRQRPGEAVTFRFTISVSAGAQGRRSWPCLALPGRAGEWPEGEGEALLPHVTAAPQHSPHRIHLARFRPAAKTGGARARRRSRLRQSVNVRKCPRPRPFAGAVGSGAECRAHLAVDQGTRPRGGADGKSQSEESQSRPSACYRSIMWP